MGVGKWTALPFMVGLAAWPLGAHEPLQAQSEMEDRPLRDFTLEELMAIEVRAPTKTGQTIREAPTVGTVITRQQIEAYGWLTLGDVLLRQAGFAPAQDFERVTVSSRGQYESWNNNHLRLLIDGVPANNVSNGIAHVWEMLPLSMVETIEIIRGPGSALYGSNATNGVVAINTRKASRSGPTEIKTRFGGSDFQLHDVTSGMVFPWVSLTAGYRRHETRGNSYDSYDASGRALPDGSLRKFEVKDRQSTHAGYLKLDGSGPLTGLSLQAHLAWWRFQTGHGWIFIVPDERERAMNNRTLAWLAYRPPALAGERLQLEFVGQWQRHEIDYRIKNLPDSFSFAGSLYPGGAVEVVNSALRDFFMRAQADYRIAGDMRALLGVENTIAFWNDDYFHESNVDLNRGGTLQPFADGGLHPMNSLFESIIDKPINQLGMFLQFASGRVIRRYVSATAGVRYDRQFFDYVDLDQPARPTRHRALDQISPRAGLVLFPHPNVTLKALGERAFRAPATTEMFVTNSLLGNSRTDQLLPEELTAFTLAGDFRLFRHLNLRADWFHQRFDNQIAFSGTKNYSANLYSRKVTGMESEFLFDVPLGGNRTLEGFLNHTFAYMLEEEVLEPTITMSDRLTWAPEQVGNAGLALSSYRWGASLQGHYQGRVHRRRSDSFQSDGAPSFFSAYRPGSVAPWFTLDALASWKPSDGLRIRVQGTNLLNRRGYLAKPGDYPFDYRIEGAILHAAVEVAL